MTCFLAGSCSFSWHDLAGLSDNHLATLAKGDPVLWLQQYVVGCTVGLFCLLQTPGVRNKNRYFLHSNWKLLSILKLQLGNRKTFNLGLSTWYSNLGYLLDIPRLKFWRRGIEVLEKIVVPPAPVPGCDQMECCQHISLVLCQCVQAWSDSSYSQCECID